jgi:thiol:disulfide interchange protein DsbC
MVSYVAPRGNRIGFVLTFLTLVVGPQAFARDVEALDKLKHSLDAQFPKLQIQAVSESILPGLYEVLTASEIIYSDISGEHIVLGQIMDAKTRESLTQRRWNELNKIDLNTLPFDKAIKIVKGDGSRQLVIFADPLCPYCKSIEASLQEVTNITVYVFLYPLETLHPGSSTLARDIWCSNDAAAAWSEWMISQKQPAATTCASVPVQELAELGIRLKINSTPTLIFANGIRHAGSLTAENIEQRLVEAAQ